MLFAAAVLILPSTTSTANAETYKWRDADLNAVQAAASSGDVAAQDELCLRYMMGAHGAPVDRGKAFSLCRQAADQGSARAQHDLGVMFLFGWGAPKDAERAVYWNRKSAEQGYAVAQTTLASAYRNGVGTQKDLAQALLWYDKAAAQGDIDAEASLGSMYLNAEGVERDYEAARKWLQLAADGGNHSAENALGVMYSKGWGGAVDEEKAIALLSRSAAGNDEQGQYDLGWMYEHGLGVAQDLMTARSWYEKSAANGYEDARKRLADLDSAASPVGSGAPAQTSSFEASPLFEQAMANIKSLLMEDHLIDWVPSCNWAGTQDPSHVRATALSVDKRRVKLHMLESGSSAGVSNSEVNSDVAFDLADLDPARVIVISAADYFSAPCPYRHPVWAVVLYTRNGAMKIEAQGIWRTRNGSGDSWSNGSDPFLLDRNFSNGHSKVFPFFLDREDEARSLQKAFIRVITLMQSEGDVSQ